MRPPQDQWAANSWLPTHVSVMPFSPAAPAQLAFDLDQGMEHQHQQQHQQKTPIAKSEGGLLCPFLMNPAFLTAARRTYAAANPSPHIVIDGLFDIAQLNLIKQVGLDWIFE